MSKIIENRTCKRLNCFGVWFVRWCTGWANIVDGMCWVVTFAMWRPDLSLKFEKLWLDLVELYEYRKKISKK